MQYLQTTKTFGTNEDEFTTLDDMVKLLGPFSYFTDALLSGEQHVSDVTVSPVYTLLNHIIRHILLVKPEDRHNLLFHR